MGIGILFLIIGIMLCKENSLENGVMILALFFLMITTGIIFIGFNGVIEILDGSYEYFILTKDGKEIKADIILRYNEFYLIFKNKTEKYISKSEIKEIDRKYKGKVN